MKAVLLILLYYVIITVTADHSAQHERCETLQSVADTDNAGNFLQCTVGQSCFSMSCTPTLPPNSDFRIFIEPCKQPAAILINATINEILGIPVGNTRMSLHTVRLATFTVLSDSSHSDDDVIE